MFSKPTKQQALALAAVFQASNQVYKLAYNGVSDKETMSFAMSTLLNQDPDSLDQLYGSIDNLQDGLDSMKIFLENANNVYESKYKEVIGYVMSSIHLASKLFNDNELATMLSNNAKEYAESGNAILDSVFGSITPFLKSLR